MYRNILVALDVNDPQNADAAMAHAGFLARTSGGQLHLLHVRLRLPKTYQRYLPENWNAENESECRSWLEERRKLADVPQDQINLHLRQGSVAEEILRLASGVRADLIIIGSHMPSTASRILGSNASAVIRDAQVNVLVVRQPIETREAT